MNRPKGLQAAGLGLIALAAALVGVSLLPWATWLGFARATESAAYGDTVLAWLVWSVAIGVVAWLATRLAGRRVDEFLDRYLEKVRALPGLVCGVTLAAAAFAAGAILSRILFAHNPHLVDSVAQLFQAKIFAGASLTAPAPREFEFFAASHLVQHAGRWFSQYPPGHPMLLAAGVLAGVPWLVNPLFAAGTLVLIYAAARRLLGEGSARLAALLLLLSPFVLFMSASYMNHVTNAFFLALALLAAVQADEAEARAGWPLLLGASLGCAAMIRPLESVAWAVVLGIWLLVRRGWKPAALAGGAGLVSVMPLLAYNALTTGHPLRFGYMLLWGPGHGLGFHTDPWGEPFTPLKSFAVTALDFQRLNVMLFGWPFPSLLFLVAALLVAAIDPRLRRVAALLVLLLLAAPAAYFFYWHRDNYLGPRFVYPSVIPALLLTALGIAALDARLGRWRPALRLTVLAAVLFGFAVKLPGSAGVISGMEAEMKLDPETETRRLGLDRALVFVRVGWGSRLVGRLWGWGIPAAETEQTFRLVDGCRLQHALDDADARVAGGADSADARAQLRGRLAAWRVMQLPAKKGLLADGSVRVDTTRTLSATCSREVVRDQSGFTHYGTLVWRNDPWLERGIVYARYLEPDRNARLAARYPGYPTFLYAPLSSSRGARHVLSRLPLASPPSLRPSGAEPEGRR